jgi:phosphatidylglycerol phospholipase C
LIAYSPPYASALLPVPNLNFNVLNYSFATFRGSLFSSQARNNGRLIFSWPDNHEDWMALSLRNEVDGVITDDPKLFLEMCERWRSGIVQKRSTHLTAKQTVLWVVYNILVIITEAVTRLARGSAQSRVKKSLGI